MCRRHRRERLHFPRGLQPESAAADAGNDTRRTPASAARGAAGKRPVTGPGPQQSLSGTAGPCRQPLWLLLAAFLPRRPYRAPGRPGAEQSVPPRSELRFPLAAAAGAGAGPGLAGKAAAGGAALKGKERIEVGDRLSLVLSLLLLLLLLINYYLLPDSPSHASTQSLSRAGEVPAAPAHLQDGRSTRAGITLGWRLTVIVLAGRCPLQPHMMLSSLQRIEGLHAFAA